MSISDKPLQIDIPVKLTQEKVVFSVGALTFEGDLPASLFHLHLVVSDVAEWSAKAQLVAIFHTNAGHVTLHDGAYNADRNVSTGNPYKELLADLKEERRANRVVWRDCEGSPLEERRFASRNQSQQECHGENDAARSRRICENYGMNPRPYVGQRLSKGFEPPHDHAPRGEIGSLGVASHSRNQFLCDGSPG
jgi:hypothetical protein